MKMVYHSTNIGYCLYATTTQYAFYNLKKKKKWRQNLVIRAQLVSKLIHVHLVLLV